MMLASLSPSFPGQPGPTKQGRVTMDMKIEKGCAARGLRKGEVVKNVEVTEVPGTGFRVTFEARGARKMVFWAANRARLQPGRYSVNTGNPLERVVLVGIR